MTALEKIFNFMDVGYDPRQYDLEAKHVSKNKDSVDKEVYTYLNEYFRPHNEKLFALIGEEYYW